MPAQPLTLSGRLRSLVSRSKTARFLYRYATHIDNRFQRTAIPAIDGPAFYKRRLWKRYLTADPAFQPIPLGPAFQRHLEALREDGIVTIKGLFVDTAARVREFLDAMELTGYRRQDEVTDFFVDLGFVIPEVMRLLCHPDLCGLFCNYYGRQAYYREHPSVEGMSAGAQGVDRTSSHVHCDGYRQITMFLLVNDVSPADTHLIYYRGTHKEPKLEYERVADTTKLVKDCEAVLGTGHAGDLIVFDSGSGYHRGEYLPGQRVIVTTVVTTGWFRFKDPLRRDEDALRVVLRQHPPHVQSMFERH